MDTVPFDIMDMPALRDLNIPITISDDEDDKLSGISLGTRHYSPSPVDDPDAGAINAPEEAQSGILIRPSPYKSSNATLQSPAGPRKAARSC